MPKYCQYLNEPTLYENVWHFSDSLGSSARKPPSLFCTKAKGSCLTQSPLFLHCRRSGRFGNDWKVPSWNHLRSSSSCLSILRKKHWPIRKRLSTVLTNQKETFNCFDQSEETFNCIDQSERDFQPLPIGKKHWPIRKRLSILLTNRKERNIYTDWPSGRNWPIRKIWHDWKMRKEAVKHFDKSERDGHWLAHLTNWLFMLPNRSQLTNHNNLPSFTANQNLSRRFKNTNRVYDILFFADLFIFWSVWLTMKSILTPLSCRSTSRCADQQVRMSPDHYGWRCGVRGRSHAQLLCAQHLLPLLLLRHHDR